MSSQGRPGSPRTNVGETIARACAPGSQPHCGAALEPALAAWEAGQLRRCLLALSAVAEHGVALGRDDAVRMRQLQALCRVSLAATDGGGGSWFRLLGLDSAAASAADARSAYRRLASLVHPDKCGLPRAAATFAELQRGMAAVAAAMTARSKGRSGQVLAGEQADPEPAAKRHRSMGAASSVAGDEQRWDVDGDLDDSWVADAASDNQGSQFPWWSEWDEPATVGQRATSGSTAQGRCTAEEEDPDGQLLLGMALTELRAEVQRRQARLLQHPTDADGAPAPMPQLHARLARARTLLAARLVGEPAQGTQLDGGFMR